MLKDMQLKLSIVLQQNISLEECSNLSHQNVRKIIHEIHNNLKGIFGWVGQGNFRISPMLSYKMR